MAKDAQRRAADKWDAKHPENKAHRRAKSAAKSFILKRASEDELQQVEHWVKARRAERQTNPIEKH